MPEMKDTLKKALEYGLPLAAAAVLLYFSFRGIAWDDFAAGLKECRWVFVLLSMAAGVFAFWLRGLRWRRLLLPVDPEVSRLTAFNAVNIAYLANLVLARAGELVRCGVITRRSSLDAAKKSADGENRSGAARYDEVLGTVVLERCWDLLSMLLILAALLVFRGKKFGAFFLEKMWAPLSERLDSGLWWILAAVAALIGASVWAVVAFRGRSRLLAGIYKFFAGVYNGFAGCLKMKDKWLFMLYTLLIWLMYWLMSFAVIRAVPDLASLGAVDAMFLMIAGSLGLLVPVPGGFGSFHFIVASALAAIYGLPFASGIVFATISHEAQTLTMILCGGVSLLCEAVRK